MTIILLIAQVFAMHLTDLTGLTDDEILLGSRIVCAEAGGESRADRRAIAGVLKNRTVIKSASFFEVATKKYQFAKPCAFARLRPLYVADFVFGWLGLGLPSWWSDSVIAFQTERNVRRTRNKWARVYKWKRVDDGELAHTFWVGDM